MLTTLTLVVAEDGGPLGLEILELELEDEVEAAMLELDVEEDKGAETKISSWAPGAQPMPMLYPGLTPFGGKTLLPVAWCHASICFAPGTQVLASVPQYTGD